MERKKINELIKECEQIGEVSVVFLNKKPLGVIVDCRITNVPKGMFVYGARHSDSDWGKPRTIENSVYVNHYGIFLTDVSLGLGEDDYFELNKCRTAYEYEGNNYTKYNAHLIK